MAYIVMALYSYGLYDCGPRTDVGTGLCVRHAHGMRGLIRLAPQSILLQVIRECFVFEALAAINVQAITMWASTM